MPLALDRPGRRRETLRLPELPPQGVAPSSRCRRATSSHATAASRNPSASGYLKTSNATPEGLDFLHQLTGQRLAECRRGHFGEATLLQRDIGNHLLEPGHVSKKVLFAFGQPGDPLIQPGQIGLPRGITRSQYRARLECLHALRRIVVDQPIDLLLAGRAIKRRVRRQQACETAKGTPQRSSHATG